MSEPPTMLVREVGDDKTVIDAIPRGEPDAPFEGSGRALSSPAPTSGSEGMTGKPSRRLPGVRVRFHVQERTVMKAGLALVALLGFGSLAHQQWRASNALREILAEMKAEQAAIPERNDPDVPRGAPVSAGPEQQPPTPSRDLSLFDRDTAESRGASLIISNDLESALVHYRALVRLFPSDVVFRHIVLVLEAKLNCASSIDVASHACP